MTAMLIRCLQKRKGGSDITMNDGKSIVFRPDENDDHVAMVTDPDHIQRLLSITEGFKIHTSNDASPAANQKAIIAGAVKSIVAGNDISGANLGDQTTSIKDVGQVALPVDATRPLADLNDEELRSVFQNELGRVPHHKAKSETMIAQIEAVRAETSTNA